MDPASCFPRHPAAARIVLQAMLSWTLIAGAIFARSSDAPAVHWKFDETGGARAMDSSPIGANAVLHGGILRGPARGLDLDGSGEYAQTPDSAALNPKGAFTISVWFKPSTWHDAGSQGLVSKKSGDKESGYVIYNNGGAKSKICIRIKGTIGHGFDIYSRSDVDDDVWQNWTIVYDPAAQSARWYRNGQLDVERHVAAVGDLGNKLPLQFGHSHTWNGFYEGQMAEVKIWTRGLPAKEIQAEFAATAANFNMTPVAQDSPPPKWRIQPTKYPTTDTLVIGYSVKEFGAKGDGHTDDTAALQRTMKAMKTHGGGSIFIPEGRYAIRGNLTVPSGVVLRGEWRNPTLGPVTGTVLMAFAGRGESSGRPFIKLRQFSGLVGISIWYPEQKADAIARYPFSIAIPGGSGANVENVTLVNSYQGIIDGPASNGLLLVRDVYGSPLFVGLSIDAVYEMSRVIRVTFNPDFWSESGLPDSPAKGGLHAAWMRAHGTAFDMFRWEWGCGAWAWASGYQVGLKLSASPAGNMNGEVWQWHLTNCVKAMLVNSASPFGVSFTACEFHGDDSGVESLDRMGGKLLFHSCRIAGNKAVVFGGQAESAALFQNCRFQGSVTPSAGNASFIGCDFEAPGSGLTPGDGIKTMLVAGCKYKGVAPFTNVGGSKRFVVSDAPVERRCPPTIPDPGEREYKPAKPNLFVITDARYGAVAGDPQDATEAVTKALADAAAAGGGIVFVPGGRFALQGHLTVPSGVELRGVFDIAHHSAGKGSVLALYAGRNDEHGAPAILLSETSGLRGLTCYYPEQKNEAIVPYSPLVQGRGADVYVINTTALNPWHFVDLMTHRCDRHYVEFAAGAPLRFGITLGGGSEDGFVRNVMFNNHYWPRAIYPDCQGSLGGANPQSNATFKSMITNHEPFVLGNCVRELLFIDCCYGSSRGFHLVAQGGKGPSAILLAPGADGDRIALSCDGAGCATVDIINPQLVSMSVPDRRYLETGVDFNGEVRIWNATLWGQPERTGAILRGGTVRMELFNFQHYAPFIVDGGSLELVGGYFEQFVGPREELLVNSGGPVTLRCSSSTVGLTAGGALASEIKRDQNVARDVLEDVETPTLILSSTPEKHGIDLVLERRDCCNEPVKVGGREGWAGTKVLSDEYRMYFKITAANFKRDKAPRVSLEVEYFDEGRGTIQIVYDSSAGASREAGRITLGDTKTWKCWESRISDARFASRSVGADIRFRITGCNRCPAIGSIRLSRL
jgi:hypothetical protein